MDQAEPAEAAPKTAAEASSVPSTVRAMDPLAEQAEQALDPAADQAMDQAEPAEAAQKKAGKRKAKLSTAKAKVVAKAKAGAQKKKKAKAKAAVAVASAAAASSETEVKPTLSRGRGRPKGKGKPSLFLKVSRAKAKELDAKSKGTSARRELRLASILQSDEVYSVYDAAAFVSFDAASAQEKAEFPNALASFFAWMSVGPTPKSAKAYTGQAKILMATHSKTIASMNSEDFLKKVKMSQENQKRNNIIAAGLIKFRTYLAERGSLAAPWENRATADSPWMAALDSVKVKIEAHSAAPVSGKGALTAHFAVKQPSQATAGSKSEDATTKSANSSKPASVGRKGAPKRQASKAANRKRAKPEDASGNQVAAENTGEEAASSASSSSSSANCTGVVRAPVEAPVAPAANAPVAPVGKVPNMFQRPSSDKATPLVTESPESSPTPARSGIASFFGGPQKQARVGGRSQVDSANESERSPGPRTESAPKDTPEKVARLAPAPANPEEQNELKILRSVVDAAAKAKDFGEAGRRYAALKNRCAELGCQVPSASCGAKPEADADQPNPAMEEGAAAAGDVDPDADPRDRFEFARGVLRTNFPLQHPKEATEEDDSEILPDEKSLRAGRRARRGQRGEENEEGEEGNGDEDDGEEQRQLGKMKQALAAIPAASFEDIDRFPVVVATFREWLMGRNAIEEEEATNMVKALHDLFTQDEKSFDAMAEAAYVNIVSEDPAHSQAMSYFSEFWAVRKNGPWASAPARAERGLEERFRTTYSIPHHWGIRVVQRVHKEDLVILTGPDGAKHYAESSQLSQLPVLGSHQFLAEKSRLGAMSELDRQEEADRRAKMVAQSVENSEKQLRAERLCQEIDHVVSEALRADAPEHAAKAALEPVLRQFLSCSACGRSASARSTDVDHVKEDGSSTSSAQERVQWRSYDDVPNATEEEIAQYPVILATFHSHGYSYMSGVRKLMELYKKRPTDMATEDFQRLVRLDPENARCNGFLNSAILYFRKFREGEGFLNLLDESKIDPKHLHTCTPDFNRGTGTDQESFEDLQVDMPLEFLMADATADWRQELRETLDEESFIQEDVDAGGRRPIALRISMLPNASDEDWTIWPNILAKYESSVKQDLAEVQSNKREGEAAELFQALKELVEEHGKSPTAMGTRKYLKMVRNTYTRGLLKSIKERAVSKFADFWALHKDGEFPPPKVHALAAGKHKLLDRARVEQAKALAAEWKLPEGWGVKLGKEGNVIKVTGPGKGEVFLSKQAALEAVAKNAKKQSEEAKAALQEQQNKTRISNRVGATLLHQLRSAVLEDKYELAERLLAELQGQKVEPGDAISAEVARPSRAGQMKMIARDVTKPGGKASAKRRAEEAVNPAPLKMRKAMTLQQQQLQEAASCELTLKSGEWRVLGVRVASGEVLPLDAPELATVTPDSAVIVLVYVDEEVRDRKRKSIVESWGLDETWEVTVRFRRSGDMVTAKRSDGKVFMSRHEILCEREREETQNFRPLVAARVQEFEQFLRTARQEGEQIFELKVAESPQLSGLYVKASGGSISDVSYTKVSCLAPVQDAAVGVTVGRTGSTPLQWLFLNCDTGAELARTYETSLDSPFETKRLHIAVPVVTDGQSQTLLDVSGWVVPADTVAGRISSMLGKPMGPCCRYCTSNRTRASCFNAYSMSKAEKRALYESRLQDQQQRRADAPRTLPDMMSKMLTKLTQMPFARGQLPKVLLQKQVLRVGTMCSGTDSPALVTKALQKALASMSGSGDHVSFEHVFSVEFDPAKQEFLKANFPNCPHLFQDCKQMGRKRAFDVLTGEPQQIPGGLDVLVAGFSCKDLSMMNSYRKTLSEMGSSGSTLRGCLDYAERYRPRLILLENVWAIAKANTCGFRQVDLVMEGLKARGYAAGYKLMNTCDYYLPQIRHRIWMWAIRIDEHLPPNAGGSEHLARMEWATRRIEPRFNEILRGLEEPCSLHFDDYMLEDDNPEIRAYIQLMKAKGRRCVMNKKKGAKLDWTQKYDSHRTGHDYQYERPYTAVRDAEFLKVLNERETELVDLKCLDILNEQGFDPRTHPMLWELSQSVERVPGTRVRRDRQNYATCILPGMLWHSSRHRWVLGIEKLALQGIFAEDLLDTDFSQKLLGDLAGNAFTTTVCAANLLAAIVCADDLSQIFAAA